MIDKYILGTVQFGVNYGINNSMGKPSEKKIFEMLDYAKTHGVNTLDTADAYGNATEILGKYNIKNPNKFEINTKFKADGSNLSTQLEASLIKLNIENINVYFYHNFNDFVDYSIFKKQLSKLKEEGRINKIGLSVYDNNEFKIACKSGLIDVIQIPFNLLDNLSQRGDFISLAKSTGKELQVRSVFLQGLFFKPLSNLPSVLAPLKPYLEKLQNLSKKYQIAIEQIALSYVIQQAKVDNIIIGVDSLQQLIANIEMAKIMIPNEIIEAVNQINVKENKLLYPKNW